MLQLALSVIAGRIVEDQLIDAGLISPPRGPCPVPTVDATHFLSRVESLVSEELRKAAARTLPELSKILDETPRDLEVRLSSLEHQFNQLREVSFPAAATDVALQDFATSATLDIYRTSPLPNNSFWRYFTQWLPPWQDSALTDDDPRVLFTPRPSGHIWSVHGTSAQIGLILSEPIIPSTFTIVPANVSTGFGTTSMGGCSPKTITIWGLIDGADNLDRWTRRHSHRATLSSRIEVLPPLLLPLPQTSSRRLYIPLAHSDVNRTLGGDSALGGELHERAGNEITIEVFPEATSLGMDFGTLVFLLDGTWGRPSLCLHRIGIYGIPSFYFSS